MKIFASSVLILLLLKFSSAQTYCDSIHNPCDSVSITSVTYLDDTIYGDKLIFRIETNHANLYAPNFIICPDDEDITFEDPNYGFFSIVGPSEVQLLYYFTDFDFTGFPEFSGRIINENSNNEFPNCEMSFNVVINGQNAILNQEQENLILLYPNPAINEVSIFTKDNSNPIKNVIFIDLNGNEITITASDLKYSLNNLPAPIYFVEIELQNQVIVRKKLMKL